MYTLFFTKTYIFHSVHTFGKKKEYSFFLTLDFCLSFCDVTLCNSKIWCFTAKHINQSIHCVALVNPFLQY